MGACPGANPIPAPLGVEASGRGPRPGPAASRDSSQKGGKQDISRVLFTAAGPGPGNGGDHLSGTAVTGGLERHWIETERDHGQPLFRGPKPWPCSQPGFTEPAPLDAAGALLPHPCTLTCAPGEASLTEAIGGVFLWHCPHGRPHRALPGRPGHWGARTFLNRPNRRRRRSPGNDAPIAITSPAFQ